MVTCSAVDQWKLTGDAGPFQEPLATATAKPLKRPNPHADGHTPSRRQRRRGGRHQPLISTPQRRRGGGDDRRRGENPQTDLCNAHDREKNAGRRHRQQDSAVTADHGASNRDEKQNHQPHDPRRTPRPKKSPQHGPACVETKKPKRRI